MSCRRAFVAIAASGLVLLCVALVGLVLGATRLSASAAEVEVEIAGAEVVVPQVEWFMSPGSMALLAASGFVLLKGRKP